MLKKYRHRFVAVNLSLVGTVLLAALTVLGIFIYRSNFRAIQTTMQAVLTPTKTAMFMLQVQPFDDFFPIPRMTVPRDVSPQSGTDHDADLTFSGSPRVCTLYYSPDAAEILVLSETDLLDEETLKAAALAAADAKDSFGRLSSLGVFYYREQDHRDYRIALCPAAYLRRATWLLVLVLFCVFAAAMGVFYLISRYLSGLALKPLEESMRREKQFVADVSHDLKTPLTVILANTAILRENPESTVENQLKWVENTEDAARNMQTMVNQMLTLSRMDSVATPEEAPQLVTVNLSDIAERMALQQESVAYDAGITLETDIPENVAALGSREYVERIIAGLIQNALKYEPTGGSIYLTLAEEPSFAALTVRNPGSVISPEDLPHVFERFYRADRTRDIRDGHGLGLAIAEQSARQMGGTLEVQSGPEQGTVFTLRLKKAEN